MSQEWFFRIMNLVPKKMQKNQREIKKINEEIKEDYAFPGVTPAPLPNLRTY